MYVMTLHFTCDTRMCCGVDEICCMFMLTRWVGHDPNSQLVWGLLIHTCTCMYTSYCMEELGEVHELAKASPLPLVCVMTLSNGDCQK